MNIKLINEPNPQLSAIEQILYNRGIPLKHINNYTHLNDSVINSPLSLGEDMLKAGVTSIINAIKQNHKALIIVDCDCDGYTSAALLINYLYKLFPSWVENNLNWSMHEGKQHGLEDHVERLLDGKYSLVICPDSSSNDYTCHESLADIDVDILVLDHHLADKISPYATIINNQLSDYPNKQLSGVGVTWQFCRYMDSLLSVNYADDFIDLVALGNCGDMMSLQSFETKYLIFKGFNKDNIKNPFIDYMIDKNSFPLTKPDYKSSYTSQACTSMGAAFFIVPFVNAVTRSGTIEEKNLIFNSMLNHKAFEQIPEVKRGKQTGKTEALVLQAVRTIGNVKNRQTKAEETSLAKLEKKIIDNNLLDHRILLFLLEPGEVDAEIRGLIANKFMAKYQRPCAILTRTPNNTYEGSMRGYTKNGLDNFKELLERCPGVLYCEG